MGVRRQRSGRNPRHVALSGVASLRYPVPATPMVRLPSLTAIKRRLRMNACDLPMANQPLRKTHDPAGDTAAGAPKPAAGYPLPRAGYPLGLDPGTR
jgi:hypothetical protein